MTSGINRLLFSALTRNWDQAEVDAYSMLVQRQNDVLPGSAAAFATVDGKASGTLTHASMMIAGLGLIAPLVAESYVELGVIVFQIAIYILIALGCLRCLSTFNSRELVGTQEDMQADLRRELIIRRELYRACNKATIVFTVIVFVTLPILFLWKP